MSPEMGCIAGGALYRLQEQGQLRGREVGRRETPFGFSEMVYLVEDSPAPYYLLPRHGAGKYRLSPSYVNHRANLYALKDLGVRCVVSWSACGAISHNYNVGDLVLVSDLIDFTRRRANTFFEDTGLGVLRQFPVFCPPLREAMARCLQEMNCHFRESGTLVVTEGPRLETPAEVRMLGNAGGELVGHNFAPDAFLAKELELCFAGVSYVVNYAETGSRYRPFSATDLFGGLAAATEGERIGHAIAALPEMLRRLSADVQGHAPTCECGQTMHYQVKKYALPDDWHYWFAYAEAQSRLPAGAKGTKRRPPPPPKPAP